MPIDIVIEPYRRIVIHEVVEYRFADYVSLVIAQTAIAGGATIPMLSWCNGVVFQHIDFNPNSEAVIAEQLKGIVHYSAVTFAIKEKFEKEVRTNEGIVRLIDESVTENFVVLADVLKKTAKYKA